MASCESMRRALGARRSLFLFALSLAFLPVAKASAQMPATNGRTSAPPGHGPVSDADLDTSFVLESSTEIHGFRVARYARWFAGVRVDGAEAIVRTRRDGTRDLLRTRGPDLRDVRVPSVDWPEALARARAAARSLDVGFTPTRVTDIEPLWARMHPDAPLEAAVLLRLEGPALAQRVRVLLGAHDGRPWRIEPLVLDARGRVYARNPRSDDAMTVEVDLAPATRPGTLTSDRFEVRSCSVGVDGSCTPVARALADADGHFLLTPEPTSFEDGFAEVNAYHHLHVFGERLERDHGFRYACPIDGRLRAFTNYTEAPARDYPNAAYVPGTRTSCGYLLFGQAGAFDFAYDADVVYHELGHAVTDQLAGLVGFAFDALGLGYEPLAVNEGTSDYWAATTQGDPHVAESLEGVDGLGRSAALRELDGALRCPDDLVGEGHFDGRIWAGAFWDLREELGAMKIDALLFATIASLGSAPSFDEAAETAAVTAEGMAAMGALTRAEAMRVRELLEARGLVGCRRLVPLDDGAVRVGYSGMPPLTGGLGLRVAPVHYAIALPADVLAVRVNVRALTPVGRYDVLARAARPVGFLGRRLQYDDRREVGRAGMALFERESPAFRPCSTLHIAIETTDLAVGQSLFAISASVDRSNDPSARCPALEPDAAREPDAGTTDALSDDPDAGTSTPSNAGCGCRAGARRRSSGFVFLFGFVASARARRRQAVARSSRSTVS